MGFYYDFEDADGFATGAIGRPGERTFYVQIRGEGRTISVKCEKQQVAALSEYLRNMLADMPDVSGSTDSSTATLQSPVEQDFVLGSVGLGVDRSNMRMVVQLEEMILVDEDDDDVFDLLDESDEDDDTTTVVRVLLTPSQARAFCDTADLFMTAGREECKWCGSPKDPTGHACPRFN
ncbi:unannotated protein [freshwater metagenome]|jgi:uncharacterized repeat protein (TIGR03847 family)|uniref:Unannotated protein n=1 Tax=freshwater metagenome TaxID=449393 RepID=A0A6J6FKE1_9ZZZZ|nr:DUF3090 family protein [Actinomycetota bacterium]